MNDATVRFRKPGDSPDSRGGTGFGLPPDLLRKSRQRIRLVALLVLLGAGLDVVTMLAALALGRADDVLPRSAVDALPFAGSLVAAASAVAIVLASRGRGARDGALLRAALVFEVFLCLVISLTYPIAVYRDTGALPQLTWVTPLVILFPLIVPCPPRLTVVTALLAASTRPFGIVVLERAGVVQATGEDYFSIAYSTALAVVFAYFGSRIVYGLGMEVAEARRLGSYSLERRLGRGGMGEVWLARHAMLARPAAVKLVRPDLAGARDERDGGALVERFEREAQATAALRSPHTVNLYDFGVGEDGTFYYVMELLEGLDAETLVRRFGPLPPERVVHVLRAVCHSLAEAHGAGLIHRDVKPANIFLCRYGLEDDWVKVLDFGLVKAMEEPERDTGLTMEGSVRGTPAYMAPEQAKGAGGVDARADLYAVGCVAYWLLTGRRVFDGETAMEVLMHHVGTAPEPPSRRTELPVPPELERIVMSCLEKDPAQRPASAVDLERRLAAVPLDRPWTPERARAWWESHRPEGAGEGRPEAAPA
jgi:serine/threonine-protein kinase